MMTACGNCSETFGATRDFETVCGPCFKILLVPCGCGVKYCQDQPWKKSCHACFVVKKRERAAMEQQCACGRMYVKDESYKTQCVGCWLKTRPAVRAQ